jgi:hypothetical protein
MTKTRISALSISPTGRPIGRVTAIVVGGLCAFLWALIFLWAMLTWREA